MVVCVWVRACVNTHRKQKTKKPKKQQLQQELKMDPGNLTPDQEAQVLRNVQWVFFVSLWMNYFFVFGMFQFINFDWFIAGNKYKLRQFKKWCKRFLKSVLKSKCFIATFVYIFVLHARYNTLRAGVLQSCSQFSPVLNQTLRDDSPLHSLLHNANGLCLRYIFGLFIYVSFIKKIV